MKILEMCEAQRPREKLLARGADTLSDAELIAILLRSGRKGESAVDMAHRLLGLVDGRLSGFVDCDAGYLAGLDGIGPSRASALLAALELGRRLIQENNSGGIVYTDPQQVYDRMIPRLKGLRHEECWIILTDRKLRELKTVRLTVGGGSSTTIDISIIIRQALESGASGIILVHNHPSGDPLPSRGDIRQTDYLRDACSACSLNLYDHIIVADSKFYSFNTEKSVDIKKN
ncbi:MAG: DNA repair protein RadC [Bacteroidales bacterium]|nr:DNA repair protein RadC [Bacteroidales bacterium]